MSKTVRISGLKSETAILLLDAAQSLDLDASVVRTSSRGHFLVPEEVAKEAGVDIDKESGDVDTSASLVSDADKADAATEGEPKPPAKKAAAKKTAAKTAAKKG